MNQELKNRFKTLCWSIGLMVVASLIDFAIQNLTSFNLPNEVTVILGLVLAQISKFIKNIKSKDLTESLQ